MILVEIKQVKREKDTFHINGEKIPAVRKASDGYAVLCVFEPSQLDKDFEVALGPGKPCFFISAKQIRDIVKALDLSDQMTRDWLRKGKGWDSGPRPLKDFM